MIPLPKYYYPNRQISDDDYDDENEEQYNIVARGQRLKLRSVRQIADERLNVIERQCDYLRLEQERMARITEKFDCLAGKKPLHKIYDLEKQQQGIKLVREYLQGVDWKSQVILLPDICVMPYSSTRFEFIKDSRAIRMVNRIEDGEEYFNKIDSNLVDESISNFRIYFYGCAGVGKSFLLYQLSCRLMNRPETVVVYVQQCNHDIVGSTLRTLFVVCKSYAIPSVNQILDDKRLNLETIINKNENEENNPDFVINVILRVNKALTNENMSLIFVIDQVNMVTSQPDIYSKQIYFLTILLRFYNVILSASDNNEVSRIRLSSESIEDVHLTFNSDEFLAFLAVKKLIDKVRLNHRENKMQSKILNTEIINAILETTGGIPLEINRFIELAMENNGPLESFSYWSSKYRLDFFRCYNYSSMAEWYNNTREKTKVLNNMLKCFMGKKIDFNDEVYDKRLIVLRKTDRNDELKSTAYFLEPISPCAREMLYRIYADDIKDLLFKNFHAVTRSTIGQHPSVLGIEKNIIILIRLKVLTKLNIVSFKTDGSSNSTILELDKFEQIEFAGCYAPKEQIKFETLVKGNKLFIPISMQYPGFDFVYFDKYCKRAFFFYVTKQNDAFEHIATNDENAKNSNRIKANIGSWSDCLPDVSFVDVYFVLKSNFEIDTNKKGWRACNIVFIEDLKSDSSCYLSEIRY